MVEFADQHRAAQATLFPDLPYRVLSPGNPAYAGKPGAVIAARWPLTPLKAAATWNFNILAARVEEPGAPFRLIVVHLTRPWPFRRSKAQAGQAEAADGGDRGAVGQADCHKSATSTPRLQAIC